MRPKFFASHRFRLFSKGFLFARIGSILFVVRVESVFVGFTLVSIGCILDVLCFQQVLIDFRLLLLGFPYELRLGGWVRLALGSTFRVCARYAPIAFWKPG